MRVLSTRPLSCMGPQPDGLNRGIRLFMRLDHY